MFGYGYLVWYQDECVSALRAALGERAYREAFDAGSALTHGAGPAYALGEQPPAAAAPGASPVTPREREIARLVAHGMSDKEIARDQVIFQRTAEGHVELIPAKPGVDARTQIAAWVGEQGRADAGDGSPGDDHHG